MNARYLLDCTDWIANNIITFVIHMYMYMYTLMQWNPSIHCNKGTREIKFWHSCVDVPCLEIEHQPPS